MMAFLVITSGEEAWSHWERKFFLQVYGSLTAKNSSCGVRATEWGKGKIWDIVSQIMKMLIIDLHAPMTPPHLITSSERAWSHIGTVKSYLQFYELLRAKEQFLRGLGNRMGQGQNLGQCVPNYVNVGI